MKRLEQLLEKINETSQMPSNLDDPLYNTPVKLHGYTIRPTVTQAHGSDMGNVLIILRPDLTREQHHQLARTFGDTANRMEDEWDKVINRAAQATWGRPWRATDYRISGIGSDEFSDEYKNKLRKLAQEGSKAKIISVAHGYAAKLKRIA